MPVPLHTRAVQDIMTDPVGEEAMLIDKIMGKGLGILCAAPKSGKSWLAMDISVCVATGQPLWGYPTRRGTVLHLPLEDTYQRITQRLWKMADEVDGELYFATEAEILANGLLEQLQEFHDGHPSLALVVIDTLQMVRNAARDYSYSAEYRDISELKQFADDHGITVLVVHHTRKMVDANDVMSNVSGTNALTGAADFTWLLARRSRESKCATLSITGRDVEQREIELRFTDYHWVKVKDTSFDDLEESKVPECVFAVIELAKENGSWEGSTTALMEAAGMEGRTAAAFGKLLAEHSAFMGDQGVSYAKRHTKNGTLISLECDAVDDGNDSSDGKSNAGGIPVTAVTPVTLWDMLEDAGSI